MSDSAMIVVVIFLAAILMFVFPLMSMADKQDDLATLTVQTATDEFISKVRTSGKLTQTDLDNFEYELSGKTGNMYTVELRAEIGVEDPSKKASSETIKIGDNRYYVMYNTQILEQLPLKLKEGDIISASVVKNNQTIGEQLRNVFYRVTGNNTSAIASASGIVTTNGY